MADHPPARRPPPFYPIIDTAACAARGLDPAEAARSVASAGAAWLQFRHKGGFDRATYQVAEAVGAVCRESGTVYILNDRVDVALMLGADGVHVGQDDLPPAAVRRVAGPDLLVGYSTHDEAQLAAALREPVDYVALGPIFGTSSKEQTDPVVGVAELSRLRAGCGQPLVAIGGITIENAAQVWAAGADSVAVISGWMDEPQALARWMSLQRGGPTG